MISTNVSKKLLILVVLIQIGCFAASTKKSGNVEELVAKKFKAATPAQLNKYRVAAAKRLQANLARALQVLSTSTNIPANVRNTANEALKAVKSGRLTTPLANGLPAIMKQSSKQQGKPAEQLKVILGTIIPKAPADTKNPLQGTLDFISANLAGVNTLLGKLLGGAPDLLAGVVKSLTGSLGAISDAVNGSLGSLGTLLGGLMSG